MQFLIAETIEVSIPFWINEGVVDQALHAISAVVVLYRQPFTLLRCKELIYSVQVFPLQNLALRDFTLRDIHFRYLVAFSPAPPINVITVDFFKGTNIAPSPWYGNIITHCACLQTFAVTQQQLFWKINRSCSTFQTKKHLFWILLFTFFVKKFQDIGPNATQIARYVSRGASHKPINTLWVIYSLFLWFHCCNCLPNGFISVGSVETPTKIMGAFFCVVVPLSSKLTNIVELCATRWPTMTTGLKVDTYRS